MLTMGISGSILALRQSLTNSNVLGGFMSAYFVDHRADYCTSCISSGPGG
jgi:hypothetical protein